MKLKNKKTGEIVYPSNDNEIVIHFEDAKEMVGRLAGGEE